MVLHRFCTLRIDGLRVGFRDEASEAGNGQCRLFGVDGIAVDDDWCFVLSGTSQHLRGPGTGDGRRVTRPADAVFVIIRLPLFVPSRHSRGLPCLGMSKSAGLHF